jgi:hypothetical protein
MSLITAANPRWRTYVRKLTFCANGPRARGNAVYRDLIRASLIVDARYLALGVMADYRHMGSRREVSAACFAEARGNPGRGIHT